MIAQPNYGAHSAQVKMRLILKGTPIRITHMGPDFVLLESPIDHPPCEASILLRVDDSESQWRGPPPGGVFQGSKTGAPSLIPQLGMPPPHHAPRFGAPGRQNFSSCDRVLTNPPA